MYSTTPRPPRIACVRIPQLALQVALRERYPLYQRQRIAAVLVATQDRTESPKQLPRRPRAATADHTLLTVVAANENALECGVRLGTSLAAARGSCSELLALREAPEQTTHALNALADALGQFGPTVSIAAPDALFIDTTGVIPRTSTGTQRTRHYGVDVSVHAILDVLRDQELQGVAAIASTPFAALALVSDAARRRPDLNPSPAPAHETKEIERLGLNAVGLPQKAFHALHIVGIRTVGAFMALPGSSIARRFGQHAYSLWRQAHGLEHRALPPYTLEETIQEQTRCDDAIQGVEPLCFIIKRLLDRAFSRLEGRGQGIETLSLECALDTAYQLPPSGLEQLSLPMQLPHSERSGRTYETSISLGHPKRDTALWLQLIRSRLQRQAPNAPVTAICLRVKQADMLPPKQLELFGDPEPLETIDVTVARLAATLGITHFTPCLREDYRPERAWEMTSMHTAQHAAAPPPGPRPTRLLRAPKPLEYPETQGEPPGALEGPERLVTGWWDNDPIARDYWVISDRWGRRSWIFREIASSRWFLHGYFD